MKAYSNWPTFPQVYVKGELLGGCDIVLQMQVCQVTLFSKCERSWQPMCVQSYMSSGKKEEVEAGVRIVHLVVGCDCQCRCEEHSTSYITPMSNVFSCLPLWPIMLLFF